MSRAAETNELLLQLDKLIKRMKSGTDNDPGDTVIELADLLGQVILHFNARAQR